MDRNRTTMFTTAIRPVITVGGRGEGVAAQGNHGARAPWTAATAPLQALTSPPFSIPPTSNPPPRDWMTSASNCWRHSPRASSPPQRTSSSATACSGSSPRSALARYVLRCEACIVLHSIVFCICTQGAAPGWAALGRDGLCWDRLCWDRLCWDGLCWDRLCWDRLCWDGIGCAGIGWALCCNVLYPRSAPPPHTHTCRCALHCSSRWSLPSRRGAALTWPSGLPWGRRCRMRTRWGAGGRWGSTWEVHDMRLDPAGERCGTA